MATQATISLQLIELKYMLSVCAQDPNRFFFDLYYRTSNRLFEFSIKRESSIQKYLSEQNGHPLESFNAWRSLYELAQLDPNEVLQNDFLNTLTQVIVSLKALRDVARLSQRYPPQCASLSQRIECLDKIGDLVTTHSSYPRSLFIEEQWACPLLKKGNSGDSTCGYGSLSFAYRSGKGFYDEKELFKLPRPEAVIYQYLYERQPQ